MNNEDLTELGDLGKEDSFSEEQKENEQSKKFVTKKMAEYLNMIENTLSGFKTQDHNLRKKNKNTWQTRLYQKFISSFYLNVTMYA